MAALTTDKNCVRFGRMKADSPEPMGVKAATLIYGGAAVVNDGGVAAPARTATGLRTLGVARKRYDNTAGAANAIVGEYDTGDHLFVNGVDAVTAAMVGADCYWVDDQTVAGTDGGGTRSVAGKVKQLNP